MSNKNENGQKTSESSSQCRFGSCKHSNEKFGFCREHFEMYMAGVIRGDGAKPIDYEKKLELFKATKKAA